MKRLFTFFAFAVTGLMLVSGCMRMGPDYRRPDTGIDMPGAYLEGPVQGLKGDISAGDRWWEAFGDPEMDLLVRQVLENNLDIRKAAARILEVRAGLVQTKADRFPSLGLEGHVSRQRQTVTGTLLGPQGIIRQQARTTVDTRSLSLPASFELDLWGRLARAEEAALADLLQAEENRRTVAQGVVSEALSLYLVVESLERRIQIVEKRIDNYRSSLSLVEGRYERGLTSILDVRQARRLLLQTESTLPPLRQELGLAQQKLAVLSGRYPGISTPRPQPEDYFTRMAPVPPGLPSDLLTRRPDIRAAEAALRALNARIGVAEANRFPRITLTGTLGYSSDALHRLFEPESELRNIAAGVVQPVFDAGRLKAGQRAAEARYLQGVAQYAQTVLSAFLEVEGALLTRREQIERRERVLDFLREARTTQEVAQNRYDRGLVDYLNVLDAMQSSFQAEENLVLVDLAILQNRVNLHRALGGGWAEPAPLADPAGQGALSRNTKTSEN